MILVWVLIFFGLVVTLGAPATAYWLAVLSCSMDASGCEHSGTTLLTGIMMSWIGLVFWATMALGLFMLWWGFRVKTHHLN